MPTPHFAFRLPANQDAKLRELASLYYDGKPNMASQFVRELIGAALIADEDRSKLAEFFTRLQVKVTGQLELELKAAQDRPKAVEKPALKAKKKGRSHGRATR